MLRPSSGDPDDTRSLARGPDAGGGDTMAGFEVDQPAQQAIALAKQAALAKLEVADLGVEPFDEAQAAREIVFSVRHNATGLGDDQQNQPHNDSKTPRLASGQAAAILFGHFPKAC